MATLLAQTIAVPVLKANISRQAFQMWARHYYKCRWDFSQPRPGRFSPVPYFLLCRAIELQLKSWHLDTKNQSQVKSAFGHNLIKAYNALPANRQILTKKQFATLSVANAIYAGKGFEYFDPTHALRGYKDYPNLRSLGLVAKKLIQSS